MILGTIGNMQRRIDRTASTGQHSLPDANSVLLL